MAASASLPPPLRAPPPFLLSAATIRRRQRGPALRRGHGVGTCRARVSQMCIADVRSPANLQLPNLQRP
ncbi:hypothetical protein ZEAMMB73_Zm00001d028021 [Zea mays]|uniref:Uncharacterized protein n=1 Tax=Zea mays TaxID=4577 RepID=A0A1D6JRB8_MAIZE|nr:hypothetical protein ZEAMMB73_Zm00001d028021 [Zea mays]